MKPIEELELREMFIWEVDHYMVISHDPLFKAEEDMIYAVKLNGEDKGLIFDFPKGLTVKDISLFALPSEMDILKIKQHNSTMYDRKWGQVNHSNKKAIVDKYPEKEAFTCYTCPEAIICKFAFDLYNLKGDCTATNMGDF